MVHDDHEPLDGIDVHRSLTSPSRQQLHLTLVSSACELLGAADSMAPAHNLAAGLQLLPAVILAGTGLPAQSLEQAAAAHGSAMDGFQALQRQDLGTCWVSRSNANGCDM